MMNTVTCRKKQKKRWRFPLLFSLLALFALILPCTVFADDDLHAVILATSDMHGNVWGYSYEDNVETENDGMARLYTYIEEVRQENPLVFLIDGGDEIQGTIMTDVIANASPENEHPVIAAMNHMGYDSMTVGNHEFNWGIKTMKQILSQARFPVLGANVLDKDGNCVMGKGWTIVERGGLRLAVIGVCTPDIPIWDRGKEGIDDTTYEAANVAVKKAIEEIGDQADLILVSAHMGVYPEFDEEGGSDSAAKIIEDNPEVDLLEVAHMHITVNTEIEGVPVLGVRNSGREIARFDVTMDKARNIKSVSTEIVDMEHYEPSEELRAIPVVRELHEQTLNLAQGLDENGEKAEPIGSTSGRFMPDDEIRGLPEGRLQDTAVIDLILKIQLLNSGADVTCTPLYRNDADLPEGPVTFRDIFKIYKFPNTLYTVDVSGKELKQYMERSAEYYNQWMPGDINISVDPDAPGYAYDMFGGVDYEINLSKPKGERIENVMYKGEPLKDDEILKLAVNNYRYSSLLKQENIIAGKRDWESSNSVRDMIVDYFADHSPVEPTVDHNWRITGIDLSVDDPRREELIGLINDGLLEAPAYKSYNLADYDALVAEAKKKEEESFYISEITDELFERIKGKSFKDDCTISREDLRYLHVLHKDIDGNVKEGEMIVNQYIAEDVLDILKGLYKADYPIEKIRLVDEYDADDEASMEDNNSSSFNFRFISHTNKVSKHGLGLAVDINTLYNPYTKVVDGERIIEPVTGEPYLDREAEFPYKIQKGDLCYKLFTEHGFEWGGDWSDRKDYQHFEMPDSVVETLYG